MTEIASLTVRIGADVAGLLDGLNVAAEGIRQMDTLARQSQAIGGWLTVQTTYDVTPVVDRESLLERFAVIVTEAVNDVQANVQALYTVRGVIANHMQLLESMRQTLSASPISATVQALIQVNPVLSGIQSIGNMVMQAAGNFFHGSHADGLPYVPFDGYVAQLHRGERVLTAAENREYGATGGVVIQSLTIHANSPAEGRAAADGFEQRIGQMIRARGIR